MPLAEHFIGIVGRSYSLTSDSDLIISFFFIIIIFFFASIQPYDRWGFRQNLQGEDEEAFLSMAKKMDRRSEELMASGVV